MKRRETPREVAYVRMASALLLAMSTACSMSAEPSPSPPVTIMTHDAEPLLQPKKVGRIVLFFVKTADAAPLTPAMLSTLPKAVERSVGDYHRATLGFIPEIPVVNTGQYVIKAPPLADRCANSEEAKGALAKALTANAAAAAQRAGKYTPKVTDFRLVVTATKTPCATDRAFDSVGVADNRARAGVIYDGNDAYEVPDSLSHELGHGLAAVGHAAKLECNFDHESSFLRLKNTGNHCADSPYGDLHSVMGDGSFVDRDLINGWEMTRLGIIKRSQVVNISKRRDMSVRLHALLSEHSGPKIIKIPIMSPEIRDYTRANYYAVEVSGTHVDEATNRCETALQCVTRRPPAQGLSVKVYAVNDNSTEFYLDSTQLALRRQKIGNSETGATRRYAHRTVFEEQSAQGLRVILCDIHQTRTAKGYADLRLVFQKSSRLVCP